MRKDVVKYRHQDSGVESKAGNAVSEVMEEVEKIRGRDELVSDNDKIEMSRPRSIQPDGVEFDIINSD
jgi:hypothetical protein